MVFFGLIIAKRNFKQFFFKIAQKKKKKHTLFVFNLFIYL